MPEQRQANNSESSGAPKLSGLQRPSDAEVEEAWREIDEAGPEAPDTLMLSLVTLRNQRLNAVTARMTRHLCRILEVEDSKAGIAQALVMAQIMTGLNYGLRIGEKRAAARKERH